jgi:hypothetical protein
MRHRTTDTYSSGTNWRSLRQIDWDFIDGEIAPLYSDKGRPGIPTRFAIGLLLLKEIYGCPMRACANAGSMIPTSSSSRGKSFSSMSSHMNAQT